MKKIISMMSSCIISSTIAYSQFAVDNQDVHVFPSNVSQSEIHISINKTNPDNIILSSNLTGPNATASQNQGHYYSTDGGVTWNGADHLPHNAVSAGDPATSFDASGNGYITGMIPAFPVSDGYFLQFTGNGGMTWTGPVRGVGPTSGATFDKEMAVNVDDMQTSPYANYYFCAWTDFATANTEVRINRSTDFGVTFNNQHTLGNFGHGTNVQTGPNGEVYVCWTNYNGGGSFSLPGKNIDFAVSLDGGQNYSSLTAFPCDGIRTTNTGNSNFNNTRVNDFPVMAVDKSCNRFRGRIYIAYPEFDVPGSNRSVIRVRHSDNNGNSWSSPVTINIPNGHQNWFPWIAVDDLTGLVNVAYFSMDNAGSPSTNTYVAYSTDGGITWQNIRVSDVPHNPSQIDPGSTADGYCGDYIGITSYGGKSYAAWYDDRNGTWQAYVSKIDYNINRTISSLTNLEINSPSIISGNATYQACQEIYASNNSPVAINTNANVMFTSGKSVTLFPGFKTSNNTRTFTALVDPTIECCSTPGATSFKKSSNPFEKNYNVFNDRKNDKDIFAYPIPAGDYITIGCYNSATARNIVITDINGRIVLKESANVYNGNQIRNVLNISSLIPGNYFFLIDFADGTYTGKFTKL